VILGLKIVKLYHIGFFRFDLHHRRRHSCKWLRKKTFSKIYFQIHNKFVNDSFWVALVKIGGGQFFKRLPRAHQCYSQTDEIMYL